MAVTRKPTLPVKAAPKNKNTGKHIDSFPFSPWKMATLVLAIFSAVLFFQFIVRLRYMMPGPGAKDTDRDVPYGAVGIDSLENFLKQEMTESTSVCLNYYLTSSDDFLEPILGRKDTYGSLKGAQRIAKEAADQKERFSEKDMIYQLVKSDRPMVYEGEAFHFSRYIWQNFIHTRTSQWKINMPFSALLSRPQKDNRFHLKASTFQQLMWFSADNVTLQKNGWLDLDPLLQKLVSANTDYPIPFAKAGFIRWSSEEPGCDSEGRDVTPDQLTYQEHAFLVPRKLKFLFLDIENIGNHPLEGMALEMKEWAPEQPDLWRVCDETDRIKRLDAQKTSSKLIPRSNLRPGEHFLIPLGLLIGEYGDDYEYKPHEEMPTLYFGPMRRVDRIALKRKKTLEKIDVRPFNPANLYYVSHEFQGGSCPYVYTQEQKSSKWQLERQVLVGANSAQKSRTERVALRQFNGKLLISEEEKEISIINYVAIEARDETGEKVTLESSQASLQAIDGDSLIITQGQTSTVMFPAWRIGLTNPTLVISGYYMLDHSKEKFPYQRGNSINRSIVPRWQGLSVIE